jgi:hypothetical protein
MPASHPPSTRDKGNAILTSNSTDSSRVTPRFRRAVTAGLALSTECDIRASVPELRIHLSWKYPVTLIAGFGVIPTFSSFKSVPRV